MADVAHAPGFFARAYRWRRLRVVLIAAAVMGTLMSFGWTGAKAMLYFRYLVLGMILLAIFTALETWPARLPRWIARWALQIVVVAVSVPFALALIYWLTTLGDPGPWYHDKNRMEGYSGMAGFSLLVAPWIAMVSVYRDISGRAERQALAFELERSELSKQALAARMSLLQAQVEPHFLFNTLANVRELVVQGSSQAPALLEQLITYLRAAVPRLHETQTTVARELELVRAYLAVMQMRIPDRLRATVSCTPAAEAAACPPGAILVLVENAVRHGIDPDEAGGAIDVDVRIEADAVRVDVTDTGVGLGGSTPGLGTGLPNLRERLRLLHGETAEVVLEPGAPRGTRARMRFPRRIPDEP